MAGVNTVILLGNLGADPEVRYLDSGPVVARISLATSESYKDKDGNKVDATEWHDIELWDGLAKVAEQYLKQGDTIYVEGKIKSNKWVDDQGNNRKSMRIRATKMTMVSRKSDKPVQSNTPQPEDIPSGGGDIDDLPF